METLTATTALYGWKIMPLGEDHYVLTAERCENHPRFGSGPLARSSPIEVLDLTRGYAITRSGTHYLLT